MLKMPRPNKDELKSYYEHHNIEETSKFFNLSRHTLKRCLKEYEIKSTTNKRKHLSEILTNQQQDYLTGNLLGDGGLSKITKNRNSRFSIKQKQEHREYVKDLFDTYYPFSTNFRENLKSIKPTFLNGKVSHENYNEQYCYSCMFATITHPIFTTLEHKWYLRNKNGDYILSNKGKRIKTIPRDLCLTWQIAAIWAADDGWNSTDRRRFVLCTEGFLPDDVFYLSFMLKRDLEINSDVKSNRIMIYREDAIKFISAIKDYIPWRCFHHKLTIFG